MGTSAPTGPFARVVPYAADADEGRIAGSICRGISKSARSSSSQSSVRRFMNCVRLALVTSVRCRPPSLPPVRFQITHVSTVPKIARPSRAASRNPGTLSSIQRSFSDEK